jgi:hypothetical protein
VHGGSNKMPFIVLLYAFGTCEAARNLLQIFVGSYFQSAA